MFQGTDKENVADLAEKYFGRLFNMSLFKEIMTERDVTYDTDIQVWTNTPDDKIPCEFENEPR